MTEGTTAMEAHFKGRIDAVNKEIESTVRHISQLLAYPPDIADEINSRAFWRHINFQLNRLHGQRRELQILNETAASGYVGVAM